ncbi:unnamed protein product, partial [marine sediment metagenome]
DQMERTTKEVIKELGIDASLEHVRDIKKIMEYPILHTPGLVLNEELVKEYEGKLNVVIVEVYEQMDLTRQYGIMAIPTQIVFDSEGQEITRHIGFWSKEEIIAQLKKMGID